MGALLSQAVTDQLRRYPGALSPTTGQQSPYERLNRILALPGPAIPVQAFTHRPYDPLNIQQAAMEQEMSRYPGVSPQQRSQLQQEAVSDVGSGLMSLFGITEGGEGGGGYRPKAGERILFTLPGETHPVEGEVSSFPENADPEVYGQRPSPNHFPVYEYGSEKGHWVLPQDIRGPARPYTELKPGTRVRVRPGVTSQYFHRQGREPGYPVGPTTGTIVRAVEPAKGGAYHPHEAYIVKPDEVQEMLLHPTEQRYHMGRGMAPGWEQTAIYRRQLEVLPPENLYRAVSEDTLRSGELTHDENLFNTDMEQVKRVGGRDQPYLIRIREDRLKEEDYLRRITGERGNRLRSVKAGRLPLDKMEIKTNGEWEPLTSFLKWLKTHK